jgi:16S rRNA U516 pseudouridylate synthase RsuA-like enzyme
MASKSKPGQKTRRFNVTLSENVYNELQELAEARDEPVLELIRQSIKIGLLAFRLENEPDAALIIRKGDTEQQIVLL